MRRRRAEFPTMVGSRRECALLSLSCLHPRLPPADYRGSYLSQRAASTRRTSSHPVPRASPPKIPLSPHRVAVAATAVPLPPPASTSPPPPSVAASRRRCRRLPTGRSRRSAASRPTGTVAATEIYSNLRPGKFLLVVRQPEPIRTLSHFSVPLKQIESFSVEVCVFLYERSFRPCCVTGHTRTVASTRAHESAPGSARR